MSKRTRKLLLVVIGIFLVIAFVDSQGFFDNKSWIEIPHGSHSHYLPKDYKDCNPPMTTGDGTMTAPGPGETINCQGEIVPEQ